MNELLRTGQKNLFSLLRTRTGFLGLGPTYGQIIAAALIELGMQKFEKRSVVREAENILAEIDKHQKSF